MPKKDIFSNPISKIKIKEKQILPGSMHELKNVKLTQEQDFNRGKAKQRPKLLLSLSYQRRARFSRITKLL